MTFRRDPGRQGVRRFLPYSLFFTLAILVALFFEVQMLSVGDPALLWRASPGDLFTLRYTHSMYGVEVNEDFLIGSGVFTLFHVRSSGAALEYFGLESSGRGNAEKTLTDFCIPRASTGNHRLLFKDQVLELRSLAGGSDSIHVKLVKLSVFEYLARVLWR